MRIRLKTYIRVFAIKVVSVFTRESGVATEQRGSVVVACAQWEGSHVGWWAGVSAAGCAGWCSTLGFGVDGREGKEGADGEVKSVHCCEDGWEGGRPKRWGKLGGVAKSNKISGCEKAKFIYTNVTREVPEFDSPKEIRPPPKLFPENSRQKFHKVFPQVVPSGRSRSRVDTIDS